MLTERRKTDRAKMADIIQADWPIEAGFSIARLNESSATKWPGPLRVVLELRAPRGVCLDLDFDGASPQLNVYVLSWFMPSGGNARFSRYFGRRNEHHKQKATDIVEGFEELRTLLQRRVAQIRNGEAFEQNG